MKSKLCKLLFTVILIFSGFHTRAQQTGKVRGFVFDNKWEPIKQATVSLLRSGDSSLIKADLSDEKGQFEFLSSIPGSFILSYSAIGFEVYYSPVFNLEAGQFYDAGTVSLNMATKQLQGVTVTSKKQLIQVRPDKTVINVENSINATGSNALELLQKSPGINVDNNDNISMKGKTGVKIYIDGKMMQLNAEDVAAYLKSINSNDIEALEIITHPGAKYDASGSAGVINIKLRKNTSLGTNGSISAGLIQGITPKGNGSVNINYREKKVNIFSNLSTGFGRNKTTIIAPRIQKDTLYEQHLIQLNQSINYNLKAGVDFFIDKRQMIGIMNTSNYSSDDWASYGTTGIYYTPTDGYIKKLDALNVIPRKRTIVNTNLNYRFADTAGKEINFDADYGLYQGRAKSYQPNYYFDNAGNLVSQAITHNNTPTDIDIYTAKLDVTLRKWKGKFGYGAKVSYVKTNNTLDFFTGESGNKVKISERSYSFVYKENVNAAYITYQRQYTEKWGVEMGLRLEQTNSEGILVRADGIIQSDNNVKRSYLDFFPNIILTHAPDPNNRFNLSYGRRVDRPNYQGLNPFELKLDELSYVKGNSFLRPQYTDNIGFTYTWKNKINATLEYSRVKDLSTQTVDTFNNYTYAYTRNLADQQIASFSISSPLTVTKWWIGFINAWANYQAFRGKVNESEIHLKLAAFGIFTQHSFTFSNDYSAELSGWFNGPSALGPTLKAKSMGAVDIGFQKLIFNKQGTIKLTATDIFRTSIPFRARTDFGGVFLQFWVRRESRTVRLNFTYRFGNNKVKSARQRQSGLENEAKRIREN